MLKMNKPLEVSPDDSSKFLPNEQMYLGIGVMNELKKTEVFSKKEMLKEFYERCRQFLITACQQIRKRYDFKCSILKNMQHLSSQNALSKHQLVSLNSFFDDVPRIVNRYQDIDLQKIDDEWRKLVIVEIEPSLKQNHVEDFWVYLYNWEIEGEYKFKNVAKFVLQVISLPHSSVFFQDFWVYLYNWEIEGEYKFKNVAKFVLQVISLPHSSAECERLFSKVNLIKTKIRNKLQTETLNGLLLSSQRVKQTTCVKLQPTKTMIDSMNTTMYKETEETEDLDVEDVEVHNLKDLTI